jgi:hypothetical protein
MGTRLNVSLPPPRQKKKMLNTNIGWKWSETIDHFATGCVIAGLVTAKPLLVGSTGIAQDDLKAMEIALGHFPKKLRRSLTQTRILLENSERGANATGKLRVRAFFRALLK